MKTITTLIFAAAFSTLASAQTIAVGPNNGGGEIVLTGRPCTTPRLTPDERSKTRHVYSYVSSGAVIAGCYFVKDGAEVHVLWHEGINASNIYPVKNFSVR